MISTTLMLSKLFNDNGRPGDEFTDDTTPSTPVVEYLFAVDDKFASGGVFLKYNCSLSCSWFRTVVFVTGVLDRLLELDLVTPNDQQQHMQQIVSKKTMVMQINKTIMSGVIIRRTLFHPRAGSNPELLKIPEQTLLLVPLTRKGEQMQR